MNSESTINQVHDLIDQRLDQDEFRSVLDNCVNDERALASWRNYHLIGDVIRGDIGETGRCLVSSVSQALDDEPTILAPLRTAADSSASSDVVDNNVRAIAERRNDAMKSAGMFAVAASVALFAVLTFSPAPVTTPVAENTVAAVAVPAVDTDTMQSFEAEFGQMLVEHGEFTSSSAMNGLVAYAKLVSNETLGQ